MRLCTFYPDAVEKSVLQVLAEPTWSVFVAERIANEELYRATGLVRRRAIFSAALEQHGTGLRRGLMEKLFGDLDLLEADEEGRLHPKLTRFRHQPRELLQQLYGYPEDVCAADLPPRKQGMSISELARLVELLVHDDSKSIDAQVLVLFEGARRDEPWLAMGCAARLLLRGERERVEKYLESLLAGDRPRHVEQRAGRMLEKLR